MELTKDLHLDDLKRALGLLEQRSAGGDLLGHFSLFGAGLLVGAGLTLLLTPLSGNELREKIHDRVDELRGHGSDGENESHQS
jgi:hypothetical protein